MAKRRRELDSDDTATELSEFKTVFVDTSLDTHLAMLVSSSDTVSEFKKKIMLEHKQCFPTIGEILIHSLKVKRRSNFYHLPDIMLVWSAFHGVKQNWFLSVDASGARTCIKTSCEFDINNSVKMGLTNRSLSSDVNRIQTLSIPLPGGASEKNVSSEMVTESKLEKFVDKTTDFQSYICSEENCTETDSRPKKKRKVGNTEDTCHNPRSEDDCNLFEASCKDTLEHEVFSSRNVMVDAVRKSPEGGIRHEQNGKGNDYVDSKDSVVSKGQSSPTTSQNLLASREREENASDIKMDHELARDAPTNCSESIYIKVPDHSARLMVASGGDKEVNANGSKKKKKRHRKTTREVQDTTEMEQSGTGESIKPYSETHESSEKKEEEKGMSLEHGHDVMMLSNSKASDHVGPEPVLKEAITLRDANAIMKLEISSAVKKGKRIKKSVNTNPEQSGIEQANNGTSGLIPSTDHIPGKTGHEEGITNHEGKDVQLLFGSFIGDAVAEVQGVNGIEGDTVILTQAEQTTTEARSGKKISDRMAQSSAGSCRADLPALETGNPIKEFHQVDKSNKNTENKDRKASKRRKNQKLTASQFQEDLSVEDQRVGSKALATKETSISFENSEQEYRHLDSSMVLSTKTEQKLNEANGIAENTYNLVETSEKKGEGINFKQYFVLGQNQDKIDSGVKLNKATKSNQEIEASKSVEDNVAPSISYSTELQSSIKSCGKKKAENKSRSRGSIRSKEDSAHSSGCNEIITNSFRGPSGASEKGEKNSGPSEMCKSTVQKPNEVLAASSRLNKKNLRSLDKSRSGRSEILHGKQGNKSSKLDMMLMKTPLKKSLLSKPGGIFQDDSEESSGDENGTMHSDGGTLSPSDSSYMSGHSVEETASQDSTRNGYGNAEGKSTGRRNMSKLDDSNDNITMDMILKSSKRFRKAKLQASQNEEENKSLPIEFVPDSQPVN